MKARFWVLVLSLMAVAASAQKPRSLVVKPAAGPLAGQELYTNSHALLIGVSRYQHLPRDKSLRFADQDARVLREVLIRSYGFPAENITVLLNEQATKAGIEKALSSFADSRRVGKDDRLLVYFSGHGQTVAIPNEGEMGFLIPHDAKVDLAAPKNAGPYLASCVQMEGLWNYLRGCPAKHALLLADACFSGLLVQPRALGDRVKLTPKELLKHSERRARQVLTAGGKGEEVFEDASLGHGAFTYKLLEELRAQAKASDEAFTASDLAASLKQSVADLTEGKQTPLFGSYRTEGEFLFVTTRPRSVPPDNPPPPPPPAGPVLVVAGSDELQVFLTQAGIPCERRAAFPADLTGYRAICVFDETALQTTTGAQLKEYVQAGGRLLTSGILPALLSGSRSIEEGMRETWMGIRELQMFGPVEVEFPRELLGASLGNQRYWSTQGRVCGLPMPQGLQTGGRVLVDFQQRDGGAVRLERAGFCYTYTTGKGKFYWQSTAKEAVRSPVVGRALVAGLKWALAN